MLQKFLCISFGEYNRQKTALFAILVGEIISSELFSSRKKARLWFNPCRGDFRTRPLTFYEVLNFVWHLASSLFEDQILHRKYAESFNFVKRRLSHRLRTYSLGNIFLTY